MRWRVKAGRTARRTLFLLDSCISPAMISSSRICATPYLSIPFLEAQDGGRRATHGVGLLKVEDPMRSTCGRHQQEILLREELVGHAQVELAYLFTLLQSAFVLQLRRRRGRCQSTDRAPPLCAMTATASASGIRCRKRASRRPRTVAVDDLKRDEFIVARTNASDEEERGVSSIHHLRIFARV